MKPEIRIRNYRRNIESIKNSIGLSNLKIRKLSDKRKSILDYNEIPKLLTLTLILLLSINLEIGFSYEVYYFMIMKHVGGSPIIQMSIVIALISIVILFAAVFGGNIGFAMYKGVYNLKALKLSEQKYSDLEINSLIKRERNQRLIIGLVGSLLLISMVAYFSFLRVNILREIDPNMSYGLLEVLLPPIFVFIEILFSSHLKIAIKLSFSWLKIRWLDAREKRLRDELHEYTDLLNSVESPNHLA